ncbi:hypothetical protein VNO78_14673 [Psophocarpus tetragonolobus]|uniref:Uncharacterized protein n=1 Tax=Psophocarpus tetragonolobus TaxID=3891 RepID=A0AAN9XJ78_PSOTE
MLSTQFPSNMDWLSVSPFSVSVSEHGLSSITALAHSPLVSQMGPSLSGVADFVCGLSLTQGDNSDKVTKTSVGSEPCNHPMASKDALGVHVISAYGPNSVRWMFKAKTQEVGAITKGSITIQTSGFVDEVLVEFEGDGIVVVEKVSQGNYGRACNIENCNLRCELYCPRNDNCPKLGRARVYG